MSIPRQFAAGDPVWHDRALPTLEDFDGDEAAFDQAMADYVTLQNGQQLADVPNFGIPEQQVFNHQTGQYETRGGMPKRFEGMSQGEFAANQLNSRFSNIQKKQASGMYSPDQRRSDLMALQSRAQIRPEEMQQAYNATRADGTAVLTDPVLTYLESLGFAPTGDFNWAPPTTGQTPEEIAANRDAARAASGVDIRAAQVAAQRAAAQPDSPFGPEDTWTVLPDGTRVNGVGDVWAPGQGTLLPGSNPVNYAGMVAGEGGDPGLTFQDIINSGIAIPGDPGFSPDNPVFSIQPFDPATSPVPGGGTELTPEQIVQLVASYGFDPNDPVQMQEALIRLRLSSSPGLIGY